jgi:elongation factor P
MYTTTDFRKGLKIEIDGEPYIIVEAQHIKPGKGAAMVKTRIKSLISGRVQDINFRSGDKVDEPNLEQIEMQFLYAEGDSYHFMDQRTYDQVMIPKDRLGEAPDYLKENMDVKVLFHNGQSIGIDVPTFVDLKITYTEPAVRGDTATGANKPATLETGKIVMVPLFISEGEVLKIDTRTGEYIERVK